MKNSSRLLVKIARYRARMSANGWLERKRREQALAWMHESIRQDAIVLKPGQGNPAAAALMDYLKGDKARAVDVVNGAYASLADWLAIRGNDPGPLFYAIRRGGHRAQAR